MTAEMISKARANLASYRKRTGLDKSTVFRILRTMENSGGEFIEVDEEEIKKALIYLGRKGFYVEPTAAATIAAVPKYLSRLNQDEVIVSVLTGHGLKSTEKMLKILKEKY